MKSHYGCAVQEGPVLYGYALCTTVTVDSEKRLDRWLCVVRTATMLSCLMDTWSRTTLPLIVGAYETENKG